MNRNRYKPLLKALLSCRLRSYLQKEIIQNSRSAFIYMHRTREMRLLHMEMHLSCFCWAASAVALHGMDELSCMLAEPLTLWFHHLQCQT